jgi:hypothetical protein
MSNPVMNDVVLQLEHAVDADVSPRTDVKNWEDPPAQFQLDGPFAKGSWGTTLLFGQLPLRGQIREVQADTSFTIEMALDRAVLSFEWRLLPCLIAERGSRNALCCRATMRANMRLKFGPASD